MRIKRIVPASLKGHIAQELNTKILKLIKGKIVAYIYNRLNTTKKWEISKPVLFCMHIRWDVKKNNLKNHWVYIL